MRQINSGIYHKLHVINPRERYTAGQFLKHLSAKELEGNLNTIFGKIPNTRQYWQKVRNDVNAMTREYGPATWFLTLSPAEWLWSDLAEYIKEVSPSLRSIKSTSELIALDPVSAARFIENKFQAVLDFICSSDNPIGKVKHYFVRREYQNRGMAHWHMMIWIDDAPIIGHSSSDYVEKFILKYITCKLPPKKVSPQLYRRVTTHQQHYHNSYCLRSKKVGKGFVRKCRFGFPRPVTDQLILRDIAVSIANRKQLKSKSRLYDLPRQETEKNINDYNPVILSIWEGNMDLQFIGEKSTLLNWYCTKYTTKTECSYGVEMFDIINSTKSLCQNLWNITLRSLTNRECGAIEAADILLGISLHRTDPETTFRWLDVNQIRSRKVKTRKEIEELNSQSTDIFCHSFIDNYYPNRPQELETWNLYDFAKWFDVSKTKTNRSIMEFYDSNSRLYLTKRSRGYLINHYTYNRNLNPEKYFYSLLLLFKPWRDLDELKGNHDTYTEAFVVVQSEIASALRYHERIDEVQKACDHVKDEIDKHIKENENENKKSQSQDGIDCCHLEAESAMQEFKEVENKILECDVAKMIKELNMDQKRIFDRVIEKVANYSDDKNDQPLRLYVSGEGGTGKSFLINTIRCWIKQVLHKDVAVLAPTGIAAFNIDGLTAHRLFQLPVEHGQTPKYRPLSDMVLKTLRTELKDTTLFIIDEVSMISNITLMYIHLRLMEIFNTFDTNDGWFGKKHVLLFGDLLQLPPVREEPPFINISKDKSEKCLKSLSCCNLWTKLFAYDELSINMRQKGDTAYREILSRIRVGVLTDEDIRILQTRQIDFISGRIDDRLTELCNYIQTLPFETICLFATCRLCDLLNAAMLKTIKSEEIKLISRDILDCPEHLKKRVNKLLNQYEEDNSQTGGASKNITVKLGAKVMLRRNIDVTLGLVNGAIGKIVGFSRVPGGEDIESLQFCLPTGVVHTLERNASKFQLLDKVYIARYQFPICLSYGITVHKCQGLSLKTIVVDVGNSIFSCGQTYVALSRVTSLDGLHIINFDPHCVQANKLAVLEYNRLRRIYKPEMEAINCETTYRRKVIDILWTKDRKLLKQPELNNGENLEISEQFLKGFINADHVSAYANAAMQCVLHCRLIREKLLKLNDPDPLKSLAKAYISKHISILDSFEIRQRLGGSFVETIPQDASEFLLYLINIYESIRKLLEYELTHKVCCKTCNQSLTSTEKNLILSLPLNAIEGKKNTGLQDILDAYFDWQILDNSSCIYCGSEKMICKTEITMVGDIIMIQLMPFKKYKSNIIKIPKYNITGAHTKKLHILQHTYCATSAIFYHKIEGDQNGHYSCYIKNKKNKFVFIDDENIQPEKQWPRGAKDAFLFIFQKTGIE